MANEEHLKILMSDRMKFGMHPRPARHIGDFTKWKDHDEYQKTLARLIRDLQAERAADAAKQR